MLAYFSKKEMGNYSMNKNEIFLIFSPYKYLFWTIYGIYRGKIKKRYHFLLVI